MFVVADSFLVLCVGALAVGGRQLLLLVFLLLHQMAFAKRTTVSIVGSGQIDKSQWSVGSQAAQNPQRRQRRCYFFDLGQIITLVDIPFDSANGQVSKDYVGEIDVTVDPGWYSVLIGYGERACGSDGACASSVTAGSRLPDLGSDLDNSPQQLAYSTEWSNTQGYFRCVPQGSVVRFFVHGEPATDPVQEAADQATTIIVYLEDKTNVPDLRGTNGLVTKLIEIEDLIIEGLYTEALDKHTALENQVLGKIGNGQIPCDETACEILDLADALLAKITSLQN